MDVKSAVDNGSEEVTVFTEEVTDPVSVVSIHVSASESKVLFHVTKLGSEITGTFSLNLRRESSDTFYITSHHNEDLLDTKATLFWSAYIPRKVLTDEQISISFHVDKNLPNGPIGLTGPGSDKMYVLPQRRIPPPPVVVKEPPPRTGPQFYNLGDNEELALKMEDGSIKRFTLVNIVLPHSSSSRALEREAEKVVYDVIEEWFGWRRHIEIGSDDIIGDGISLVDYLVDSKLGKRVSVDDEWATFFSNDELLKIIKHNDLDEWD